MVKKKIESELKGALKGVRNTTTMVNNFLDLLKKQEGNEEINSCLQAFHDTYSKYPCYQDVKESIVTKVEVLGIDADHVNEIL